MEIIDSICNVSMIHYITITNSSKSRKAHEIDSMLAILIYTTFKQTTTHNIARIFTIIDVSRVKICYRIANHLIFIINLVTNGELYSRKVSELDIIHFYSVWSE